MEEKFFSGYFCVNCNMIPLIQIIQRANNAQIFTSCKCHKQIQNIDSFIRNNSKFDKIHINKIPKEPINNEINKFIYDIKIDANQIITKLNNIKEEMDRYAEIKDKIIDFHKRKIDEIGKLYKYYLEKNNKIISIIERLITSYQLIEDNSSNRINILNNCNFNEEKKFKYLMNNNNIEDVEKEIEKIFKYQLIIIKSTSLQKNSEYFYNQNSSLKCFIELDDNICAYITSYSDKVNLCNLNNIRKEIITFRGHLNNINWIICSYENHLISCGDDSSIKIWPKFSSQNIFGDNCKIIKEIKKTPTYYIIRQISNINLTPFYEYKYENKDIKFLKIVLLKKAKQFLVISKCLIFLFNYLIREEIAKIELIKKNEEIKDIIDMVVIEKNKNEIISVCVKKYLFFLDIPNLHIIKKIEMNSINKNSIFQLNSNELLIIDSIYYFKIFDINKFQVKLIIKDYNSSDYLLNLKDGTIITSGITGIKRYLIKNFQELYYVQQFNDSDDYYDYYESDYYSEQINYMEKLKDGRIVLCHQNGKIEIINFELI